MKNTYHGKELLKHRQELVLEKSGPSAFRKYMYDFVVSWISEVSREAQILGLGVGNGELESTLLDLGFTSLFAADIDDYLAEGLGARIDFKTFDFSFDCYPYRDNSMDVITSIQVLEHLENPWQFLREIRRILKPGGYLLISYPTSKDYLSRLRFLRSANVHGFTYVNNHISFFPRDVDRKLFEGFQIQKSFYFEKSYPSWRILHSLIHRFAPQNSWFCHKAAFVMRKIETSTS